MSKFREFLNKFNILIKDAEGLTIIGKILASLLVIVIALILTRTIRKVFKKYILNTKMKVRNNIIDEKKVLTISSVIDNALKYIIYFISTLIILDIFKVNTRSITTFAGVGGIILGLGTQTLVRDLIAGFFIIFEGQYSIGDSIIINNAITGNVIEFGMKNTKIKGNDGAIITISNGNITTVKNISINNQRALVEIVVPTYIKYADINNIVANISKEFSGDNNIVQLPYLDGITDIIAGNTYKITIIAWTKPGKGYATEVKLRNLFMKEINEKNTNSN